MFSWIKRLWAKPKIEPMLFEDVALYAAPQGMYELTKALRKAGSSAIEIVADRTALQVPNGENSKP